MLNSLKTYGNFTVPAKTCLVLKLHRKGSAPLALYTVRVGSSIQWESYKISHGVNSTRICNNVHNFFFIIQFSSNFYCPNQGSWYMSKVIWSKPPPTLFILLVYASLVFGPCHKSNAKQFFFLIHLSYDVYCLNQGCLLNAQS